MSTARLRWVLVAVVAAVLIAGIVVARTRGGDHAPAGRPSASNHSASQPLAGQSSSGSQHPAPAVTSVSQLGALLPHSAGNLKEDGPPNAPEGGAPYLPKCIEPNTLTSAGTVTPDSPLKTDMLEPIAMVNYEGGPATDFDVAVFRLGNSGFGPAQRAVQSARGSCTDPAFSHLFVRQQANSGDEAASYDIYRLQHLRNHQIRGAVGLEMVILSGHWGVVIWTTGDYPIGSQHSTAVIGKELTALLGGLDRSLGTSFAPAGGQPVAVSFPGQLIYISSGGAGSEPTYKPRSIVLSGDASLALTGVTWTSWTSRSAEGTGTVAVNLCNPNCAAGDFHNYRAQISASRPTYKCLYPFFSKIVFHYVAARPPETHQDQVLSDPPDCDR